MTSAQATRQLHDPAGTVGVYYSTVAIAVVSILTGIGAAVSAVLVDGADTTLSIGAVSALSFAGVVVVVAANPFRAPFTMRAHGVILVGMLLAVLAGAASTWGVQEFTWRENWVPVSVGIMMIALGPYRPAREIVAVASVTGVAAAASVYLKAAAFDDPPLALAAAAFVAVASFGFGSAAYSAGTLRSLERRRRRIENAADALAREMRDGIARSVQQDSLTILERDVVPFFAEVLEKKSVTAPDRARAADIADSIRRVMVAGSDRTWLETMFGHPIGNGRAQVALSDPDGLAGSMTAPQRTVLRTLLVALGDDPDAARLSITLARDDRAVAGVLTVEIDAPESAIRAAYGAYFAVMRVTFDTASLEVDHPYLIVRFSYGRP